MRRQSILVMVIVFVMAGENIASATIDTFGTGANQFTIDFDNISGDTNPASGYGIVNNDYRMGTYEITNGQWNKFTASLGMPVTGNPASAYDRSSYYIGLNVPTNGVSWYEAAQFVNWLNTSTSHQAAYKFTGTQGTSDYTLATWSASEAAGETNLYRHKDAFYFLPTEDEWVKAAYWNGTTLQTYSNASVADLIPGLPGYPDKPDPTKWNYAPSAGSEPWDVGSGVEELNGTFDMMGNIWEWMESPYNDPGYGTTSNRGWRGGSFTSGSLFISSSYRIANAVPQSENDFDFTGFRVASILEPTIGGYIDWTDLAAFCERWLEEGCSDANDWCGRADINRSSVVDSTDYSWLAKYWASIAPEPNAAVNPVPNDTATDVNITADLSWTAGSDTAAHGVYFGTNPTPDANEFQGYQTETIFDPGLMDVNTIYYWQVDEVGLGGETIGEVWSFTVNPLGTYNPFPSDGATFVPTNVTCTWQAGTILDGVTGNYDVFFGTDEADVNEADFGDPEWLDDPPEADPSVTPSDIVTVEKETEYFWRVASLDSGWNTLHRGTVWSFTTVPYIPTHADPCFIGWWRFDEESGVIAYDSSGSENHGQLVDGLGNGLVWAPAEGALNFDGSNNLSRVVVSTVGMSTTAGTIAIWANLTEPQIRGGGRNGSGYFFGCDNGVKDRILLYMDNSNTQLDVRVGDHSENNIITLSTENWYHISLTWNAGTYSVYVNGLMLDTGSYSGLTNLPSTADIGNNGGSYKQSFHGLMGDVQVYDKSLSTTEIQELYQDVAN